MNAVTASVRISTRPVTPSWILHMHVGKDAHLSASVLALYSNVPRRSSFAHQWGEQLVHCVRRMSPSLMQWITAVTPRALDVRFSSIAPFQRALFSVFVRGYYHASHSTSPWSELNTFDAGLVRLVRLCHGRYEGREHTPSSRLTQPEISV